jgi:hypothetical protein
VTATDAKPAGIKALNQKQLAVARRINQGPQSPEYRQVGRFVAAPSSWIVTISSGCNSSKPHTALSWMMAVRGSA